MPTILETFKEAKAKLLAEFKTKQAEVAELRRELVKLGAIAADDAEEAKAPRKKRGNGKPNKRIPINEEDVIKFLGNKECGYKEVAEQVGKGAQTVKKWLDNNKNISKRYEDPKNRKSKVFYKVK